MKKVIWSLIVYTLFLIPLLGQKTADTLFSKDFFIPKNDYSPKRMNSLIGFWGITYGAFSYGLYQSWYKNQNLQPFHFFNDGKEWQQMDKAGHFFSGYFQMAYNYKLARWTGLDKKKSLIYSSAISTLFLTTLEFFDGFGEGWGFSGYDMASNLSGTGSFLIQETLWNEQRILVKESVFPVRYARQTITSNGITTSLEQRASKLYGQSLLQRALKDYNVQTYWLSMSPHSFGWSVWPKWLNLSFGYGAQGMFGGLENKWSTPSGIFDYTDQPRYRQLYLAPDINFSKINLRSPFLKTIFNAANIIKTPTPALEYNRIDGFVFHLIFF